MDPESNPQSSIITNENDVNDVKSDKVRINQGSYVALSVFFIAALVGHIVTIVLGVPMFSHCYYVALVVMVLGSVLGLLQLIPEFVRNFIKIKPKNAIYVNYIFGLTIVLRVIWLIVATVVIVNSNCDNITTAWVCIYVNWGVFAFIVLTIIIAMIVKYVNGRRQA